MIKIFVSLANRTKAAIVSSSKTVIEIVQNEKTKLASAITHQKTVFVIVTGVFFGQIFRQYYDSVAISELFSNLFGSAKADSVGIEDTISTKQIGKNNYESLALADNTLIETHYYRSYYEYDQVADSTNLFLLKQAQDYTDLSDEFLRDVNFNRSFNDTTTATDDLNGAAADDEQNIYFFKNKSNIATVGDLFSSATYYSRSFLEFNNISDNSFREFGKLIPEPLSIFDNYNRTVDYYRVYSDVGLLNDINALFISKYLFENNNVSDVFSRTTEITRSFNDTTIATDDLNGAAADDEQNIYFFKVKFDNNHVTDNFSKNTVYNREYAENVEFVETFIQDIVKNNIESTGITDDNVIFNTKSLFDQFNISSELLKAVQYNRDFTELEQLTEVLGKTLTKDLSDVIQLTDIVLTEKNTTLSQPNIAGVSDLISNSLTKPFVELSTLITESSTLLIGKNPSDVSNASSDGLLTNQNYGADYFQEDYVGVSRSFS